MIELYRGKTLLSGVTQGLYSDNTPFVKGGFDEWLTADTMVLRPDSLQEFMTGLYLTESISSFEGAAGIDNLILPYLPGARQDRVNVTGDVLYTLSSIARDIMSRGFRNVVIFDPHSDESHYQFGHKATTFLYPDYVVDEFADYSGGYGGIIAPDIGSQFRADVVADALSLPVYYGSKTRDVSTGRLSGFYIDPLERGGHYLIVDDICDGGGTFIGLNEKIREQGATADLYVSHGIFSKGWRELLDNFGTIYTTDSRFFTGPDRLPIGNSLKVIPLVDRLLDFTSGN